MGAFLKALTSVLPILQTVLDLLKEAFVKTPEEKERARIKEGIDKSEKVVSKVGEAVGKARKTGSTDDLERLLNKRR
jgi:hypothetical protein